MIALVLAASYPDRVRSLALLEPLPPSSWLAVSDFADLLGSWTGVRGDGGSLPGG